MPSNRMSSTRSETIRPESLKSLLGRLLPFLNQQRRVQLLLLVVVMLGSSIAEVFSLAAIIPFLAVLVEPNRLWEFEPAQSLARAAGITQAEQLVIPVTVLFCVVALLAAGTRLLNLWLNGRLAAAIGSDLSCEAYRRTLFQPYSVHVRRNSSTVIATLVGQVSQVVSGILNPLLQMVASGLILAALLITLVVVDWRLTLAAGTIFITAYAVIVLSSRQRLQKNSQVHTSKQVLQVQALQEGLGAIRDVILDGSQRHYLSIYSQADRPIRQVIALSAFIANFPRYAMEAVAMIVIASLALVMSGQYGGLAEAVPVLGAFALGAQRMLPALQQTYSSWATIRGSIASLDAVLLLLDQELMDSNDRTPPVALKFSRAIAFSGVAFRYGPGEPWVLDNLDFVIRRGERVGIIGATGSGKSTTLDLLMGLLEPSRGEIQVDGISIHSSATPDPLLCWRENIAHVPQSIYLADTSIAENIAFGRPSEQIDMEKVRLAARQAQIAEFIEASPLQYQTRVGERGIRLSGGQRQRIGIARALYKQAGVLVLDEATPRLR